MSDPGFDVSTHIEFGNYNTAMEKVEFIVYTGGLLQRTRLSAGNAVLLGKQLQREGEAILIRRKGKK